jgi:hypothetical protein
MRSRALRGLLLNLGISALPGIAWSAHPGGGLAGALVALAYGRPSHDPPRWPVKAAAIASFVFVVLGALHGALGTDMGFLTRPPVYARADLGWGTAELPVGLSHDSSLFGDLAIDPGTIQVERGAIDPRGWKDFEDGGEVTEGDLAVHRDHLNGVKVAVAREAGNPASPTVAVAWWDGGPWDSAVASHVLRSIERR